MELNEFITLMGRKKGTIFSLVILFLLAGVIFTAVGPFKYGAKSKLLVVQSFDGVIDPYVASKSTEYLSNVLAKIVSSDSFFQEVLSSGYRVDQGYFPERADKRLKEWAKTAEATALSDTGIIEVNIYHPDKYQAGQIAEAVNYVLKTKNNLYHGGGDKVSIKIIDQPIVSRFFVKPNIVLNLSLAFALGLVFALCYVYLLPEGKYDIRVFPRVAGRKKPEENLTDIFNDFEEGEELLNRPYGQINNSEEKSMIGETAEAEDIELGESDDLDNGHPSYEDIVRGGNIKNIL